MLTNNRGRCRNGTPNPVDIYIGRQIRRRRLNLGLTQENLAAEMGLTFQQIQKYERGLNRISGSRLWDISQILKVPLNYFFCGIDEKVSNQSPRMLHRADRPQTDEFFDSGVNDLLYQPETIDLLTAYYNIKNPQARRTVFELLMTLSAGKT